MRGASAGSGPIGSKTPRRHPRGAARPKGRQRRRLSSLESRRGLKTSDRSCGHQRLRPYRPQLLPGAGRPGRRRRDRRRQRPDRQRHPGAPAQVRQHPRPVPGRREGDGRRDPGGRQQDHRPRGTRSRQAALGRPRRRHRHRVHRILHRRRQGPRAHRGWREEGHHLRARQGRGRHDRHGRQRRRLRPGQALDHQQRLVHHELPRADGQGHPRHLRHRERPDDDDPRLHQRPGHPRLPAQGPAPSPRRRPQHDPDEHRRCEGHRSGPCRLSRASSTATRCASRSRPAPSPTSP